MVFAVASLMCGLAPGPAWLLAWRAVQGIGGGILAATSTALVTSVFPPHQRGRALGLNVMALYLGLATGPLIGGLIVEHAGWRWIFLVNIPIAALAPPGLARPARGAARPRTPSASTRPGRRCSAAGWPGS